MTVVIERSFGYIVIKPVRSKNDWTATIINIPPEEGPEYKERQTKGNRIKKETETTRDLKIVLSDHLDCSISDFDRYNERQLLDLFHENFAGLYGNSSGKNIEIVKYLAAKERDRKVGKKGAVWRVE